MNTSYFPPSIYKNTFNCPHCNVYTTQSWSGMWYGDPGSVNPIEKIYHCECDYCHKVSIWQGDTMIIPSFSSAPMPHRDMPIELIPDYEEARSIAPLSPRGAAALLRLVLEKLLTVLLGENSKGINENIASLVRNGLPTKVEQAFDIVRLVGNSAVHPGKIDLEDAPETVVMLFDLINFIVENQITLPKMVKDLEDRYFSEGQRLQINARQRPVPAES